ncbi:hypothetical protein RUM44_007296 [Polyplax serrata]|uniref:EFHB C-terminal EF-hand domain-containing protein n=1 Tax=Polyplax serrata TaxID=468196 RepID=A0ABR1B095_POLSC
MHVHQSPPRAGKSFGDPRASVKGLLQEVKLEDKIDALKRDLGVVDSKDLCSAVFKGPDLDVSGAFTEIRHCLRKPVPTQFQCMDEEIKNTIYDSYWNKPLGKSRDATPGLPFGMKPEEVTFGISTKSSEPGSLAINPKKPAELVEKEERDFHDLYAFSHQNYYSGEQIKRNYAPPFNEHMFYGKSSGKDDSGNNVRRCLTWFNNDPLSNVSRRLAAVRNRTLPPLGKALDKTGVTDKLPSDHTFGRPTPAGFYGVEDLLCECPPSLMRRDMLTFLACANKLRHNVSHKISTGELELEELFDEMSSLTNDGKDSTEDCIVHFDCVERIMRRHGVFLDRSKMEPLLLMLGLLNQNFEIRVRDFINFIDKNSVFPELKRENYILPSEFQMYKDPNLEEQDVKDDYKILSMPRAGESTFRLDAPRPFYKDSLVNMDHLGQETTARALISPSIYTQYGLSHRDFLKPRNKEFLGKLFAKIGVTLNEEELEEIYQEGHALDQTGGVSVETFRNLLDQRVYKAYKKL